MPNFVPRIPDIEINGHVYTQRDWLENTAGTISALAGDIAAVAAAKKPVEWKPSIEWEPSECGAVLDGGKLRPLLPSEIEEVRRVRHRPYRYGAISAADMRRLEGLPPLPQVGESPIGTVKRMMDDIDHGQPALNYQTSVESLPIDEPGEPPRWRSVVEYSRDWVRTDQPPKRELAPFPAQALRSAPGVAPLLEISGQLATD